MKILNIFIVVLVCLMMMIGAVSANDISIEYDMFDSSTGDNIVDTETQYCDVEMQNIYPIKQVRNCEADIKINNIQTNTDKIYVYVDGLEDNSFASGGIYSWKNDKALYSIPHNLGEGKHQISFLCMDKMNNVLSKKTYDLIIETNETNESPFFYEIDYLNSLNDDNDNKDDKDIITEYNIQNQNTKTITLSTFENQYLLQNNSAEYIDVSLGDFIIQKQNNFDIIGYILSFFK